MLMEQQFALKVGVGGDGHLDLAEQNLLTAEDRAWWYKRLKKLAEDREKQEKASMPRMPHISKSRRH